MNRARAAHDRMYRRIEVKSLGGAYRPRVAGEVQRRALKPAPAIGKKAIPSSPSQRVLPETGPPPTPRPAARQFCPLRYHTDPFWCARCLFPERVSNDPRCIRVEPEFAAGA